MAVLHDYRCETHGIFESRGPHCPDCGRLGERVYLQAPAAHTGRVAMVDGLLTRVLGEFGMTDVPKPIDARETNVETRRIRSRKDQPLPQAVPVSGTTEVPINAQALAASNSSSAPAREAFRMMQGGSPVSFGKEVAKAPSAGSRRPRVSLAIRSDL